MDVHFSIELGGENDFATVALWLGERVIAVSAMSERERADLVRVLRSSADAIEKLERSDG